MNPLAVAVALLDPNEPPDPETWAFIAKAYQRSLERDGGTFEQELGFGGSSPVSTTVRRVLRETMLAEALRELGGDRSALKARMQRAAQGDFGDDRTGRRLRRLYELKRSMPNDEREQQRLVADAAARLERMS